MLRTLAGALLALGAVLNLVATGSPTVQDQTHLYTPASIPAPPGSYVLDTYGQVRTGNHLSTASSAEGQNSTLTLPILEAGTYLVATPRPAPGGDHLPVATSLTIGGGTTDHVLRPAVSPIAALALAWVLLSILASLAARRPRVYYLLLGMSVLSLLIYALSGSSATSLVSWLAATAFAAATLLTAATARRSEGNRVGLTLATGASAILVLGPAYPLPFLIAAGLGLALESLRPAGTGEARATHTIIGAAATACVVSALLSFSPSIHSSASTESDCADLPALQAGECWAAVLASRAGDDPQTAVDQIAVLEKANPELPSGHLCRVGGNLLGAHYSRTQADPHAVFSAAKSPCDFSFVHGVAIGAVLDAGVAGATAAAVDICRLPGPSYLPQQTYLAQCWHGAGQGIARLSNLNPDRVEDVCSAAPNVGARANCVEGLYLELLDDSRRGLVDPSFQHAASDAILQACDNLADDVIAGCWRYWVSHQKEAGVEPSDIATDIISRCGGSEARQSACWEGVGDALTGVGYGEGAGARLSTAVQTCDTAPQEKLRVSCTQRALNNVIDPRGSDEDLIALCDVVREDLRQRVCTEAFRFREFLTGKSSN